MLAEAVECEVQFAEDLLGDGIPGLSLPSMREYLRACRGPAAGQARHRAAVRLGQSAGVHGAAGRAGTVELLRAPGVGLSGGRHRHRGLRPRLLTARPGGLLTASLADRSGHLLSKPNRSLQYCQISPQLRAFLRKYDQAVFREVRPAASCSARATCYRTDRKIKERQLGSPACVIGGFQVVLAARGRDPIVTWTARHRSRFAPIRDSFWSRCELVWASATPFPEKSQFR